MILEYYRSSIGKKQIIALTGLCLIVFVVMHLGGNFTFYFGPQSFNTYAEKLKNMRPLLNVFEYGLLLIFLIHLFVTVQLIFQKRKFRKTSYAVSPKVKKKTFSSGFTAITGIVLFVYIILHLFDFTFNDHQGIKTVVKGKNLGLYGLVFNSFSSFFHSLWYIFAMVALAFHLDHGFQSVFQTFGLSNKKRLGVLRKVSRIFALCVGIAYASIPMYVFFLKHCSCLQSHLYAVLTYG